jgi:hypothetical protein
VKAILRLRCFSSSQQGWCMPPTVGDRAESQAVQPVRVGRRTSLISALFRAARVFARGARFARRLGPSRQAIETTRAGVGWDQPISPLPMQPGGSKARSCLVPRFNTNQRMRYGRGLRSHSPAAQFCLPEMQEPRREGNGHLPAGTRDALVHSPAAVRMARRKGISLPFAMPALVLRFFHKMVIAVRI